MSDDIQAVIAKIQDKLRTLPPERVLDVDDFIDFVADRDRESALMKAVSKASVPSFNLIWNNADDDAYDAP